MQEIIFKRYMKNLWFVYKYEKCIAAISKNPRKRRYETRFYRNKKIRYCTTYALKTAKEIVLQFGG